MIKIKVYKGGIVKLPAKVRRDLGLKEGDLLMVTVEEKMIKLIPLSLVDPVEAYSSILESSMEDELFEEGLKDARKIGQRKRLE